MTDSAIAAGLDRLSEIRAIIGRRRPAFFLDFDGTLAPLAARPELVELPERARQLLAALARDHLVCVVSGRGLNDLRTRTGLAELYYAADHGHRVQGPAGTSVDFEVGPEDRTDLEAASYELDQRLRAIEGAVVQTKGVSLSVHYRLVSEDQRPAVRQIVTEVAKTLPGFRLTGGKLVHEFVPDSGWNKGQAVMWLLRRARLTAKDTCPLCLGDDRTDEDMFEAVRGWGVSLVVGRPPHDTRADYILADHEETAEFLRGFVTTQSDTSLLPG
ncbi:MAG: trehalose-phosphatase [Thermoleophilia bacterium]|nr:trehalose-phosphatase [Thermoleophilia bacterium]